MGKWKVASRKKLLKTKFFDVEEEKIILPNGTKHIYKTAVRKPVSMVIPLTEDYEIYMIKQYRYLYNDCLTELVAGHIDDNESPLAAAKRELKEETGLTAKHWEEIKRLEGSASVFKSKVHLFLAKDLEEGKSSPEDGEEIDLIKVPLKKAVEMVMNGEVNTTSVMYAILLLEKLIKEKRL